jgi:hypothetical protein
MDRGTLYVFRFSLYDRVMVMAYGYASGFHTLCIGIGFIYSGLGLWVTVFSQFDLLLYFYLLLIGGSVD